MSVEQFASQFGSGDGVTKKIEAAGFWCVKGNGGGAEGWKEIDGVVCYVDHWGAVFAQASVGQRRWSNAGKWVVWSGKEWVAE